MEYLNYAQMYLKFKDSKKALGMLHKMVEDIKEHDINEPENFRDIWCLNEISNGKRTITMNLYENIFKIFEAAEFDLIRESKEFICIMNDLKNLEKKSLREK